jgi:ATP:ADP antiporter, AAA family
LILALQFIGTGRFIRGFGMAATLASLPLLTMLPAGLLSLWSTLATFLIVQTARRAAEYALAGPAREVLYTTLNREDKYKATPVTETAVRRGGDAGSAWLYAFLAQVAPGTAWPLRGLVLASAAWLACGVWLARERTESGSWAPPGAGIAPPL